MALELPFQNPDPRELMTLLMVAELPLKLLKPLLEEAPFHQKLPTRDCSDLQPPPSGVN